MTSKFTPLYVLFLLGSILFLNASGGPSGAYADAPGDDGTCANCHFWGGPPSIPSGGISLIGAPSSYQAGQTYTFKVRLTDAESTFDGGGFQLLATDGNSNAMVGSFSTVADTKIPNQTSGRLTHASPKTPTNGAVEWDVIWQAPATAAPAGVTFYYAGNASNLNGGTNGDRIYTGTSAAALPVELTDFTARATPAGTQLAWQTANEQSNDYFAVERSVDGRHFAEVGRVAGRGTTAQATDYEYLDTERERTGGLRYYRLRQVDYDGQFSLSQVITVELAGAPDAGGSVFPNPVGAEREVTVGGAVDRVELFDGTGRLVQRYVGAAANRITLPQTLPSGVYVLRLGASGRVRTERLVVR